MDKIQRQILKNQSTIMSSLTDLPINIDSVLSIRERMKETTLLFVGDSKEPCCDMEETRQ